MEKMGLQYPVPGKEQKAMLAAAAGELGSEK